MSGNRSKVDEALERARYVLLRGRSPLIATACGPNDPAVTKFRDKLSSCGLDPVAVNARIGSALGEILRRLVRSAGVKRGAVSGGDSSGFAMRALGA